MSKDNKTPKEHDSSVSFGERLEGKTSSEQLRMLVEELRSHGIDAKLAKPTGKLEARFVRRK